MSDFKIVKLLGSPITLTFTGGITPQGEYNGATAYVTGDSVSYSDGNSYVAIQATTGNLPTDTAYWQLLAEKGDQGIQGIQGIPGSPGLAIEDADGDTKVEVEASPDEDKIRFTAGGTEELVIDSTGLDVAKNIEIVKTSTSTAGVITKDGNSFIHDFSHPTGGAEVPLGDNLFIGSNAGNFTMGATASLERYASFNSGIGKNALKSITTGYGNTAFGADCGNAITTGYDNLAMGYQCLNALTVGISNVALGTKALYTAAACYYNVAIGFEAMNKTTTASYSVGIGYNALKDVTIGYYNVAIGHFAGSKITTSGQNVAIGPLALRNSVIGNDNVAIGMQALFLQTGVAGSVAIGAYALTSNTSGLYNTAVGYDSLRSSTGSRNTTLGYSTVRNAPGSDNTAIGYAALGVGFTLATSTALGSEALGSTFIASGVTAIGYRAGKETISSPGQPTFSATDSIFIGRDSKSANIFVDALNQIVIGANAASLGDNTTVIGNSSCTLTALRGKVGAGVDAPATALHVNGAITANELSADPADPAEGQHVTWQSDGTGSGDDGDIMMKITAGGVTKTTTLVDFSTL